MTVIRDSFTVPGLSDGLQVPYVEFRGRYDGPHLTVIAGIHGCEYTGMAAVRRLIAEIDPDQLRGRITAVPVVAVPSFLAATPFVVPQDGKNLNRCFPGDPGGSYTEILAHHVFERFFLGSDCVVDLHAGDIGEALEAMTIYDESPVEDEARALAHVFGTKHVVRQPAGARTVAGTTSAAAADAGIPAIAAESGGNGLLTAADIDLHVQGVHNVIGHLGMLPIHPVLPEGQSEHTAGWNWVRAPVPGWWESQVELGEPVEAGKVIGHISNIHGDAPHEITAPESGIPLILATSPSVSERSLLVAIARRTE